MRRGGLRGGCSKKRRMATKLSVPGWEYWKAIDPSKLCKETDLSFVILQSSAAWYKLQASVALQFTSKILPPISF